MAHLYYMNPPPNPFWDFVADIDSHPMFRNGPHRGRHHHGPPPPAGNEAQQPPAQSEPEMSEKARGKQATAEDPPEVDPSTVKPDTNKPEQARGCEGREGLPFRGRGRCGGRHGEEGEQAHGGRGGHHWRGRGGWAGGHRGGPPPFMFGHPFFAGPHPHPPPPGHHHHHGPPHEHARGPHRRPSPHHHHGPRGPGGPGGFDLGQFLNRLGDRLGVDLSGAAEGLGLNRFTEARRNQDADFEPRTDIFENSTQYTIHLSLPGAKKEDVGVDWDGENSVLHIAGVVHRPGADEQMLSELVVDGRKRETGVFEKAIRLGTKHDPASIDVTAISAKMTDGVLVVKVPKVEVVHEKREVSISSSHSSSPHAHDKSATVFDADQEMYDTVDEAPQFANLMDQDNVEEKNTEAPHTIQSRTMSPEPEKNTSKATEAAHEDITADKTAAREQLPAYEVEEPHGEDDWEKYRDEEEGEYVKINVD